MKNPLLYIMFFILIRVTLYSNDNREKIYWNDREINIIITTINKINYIEINELSKLFAGQYNRVDNTISFEQEQFKFSPNSFYIVYRQSDSLRVAQMTMPAIWNNNTLLIPYNSIFTALMGINLIDYDDSKNKKNIKTHFFTKQSHSIIYQETNDVHLTNKDTLINTKLEENNIIKMKIEPDTIKRPNKYLIPNNIKK